MGPEQSREYDAEIKRMADAGMPGQDAQAPKPWPLGSCPPLHVEAPPSGIPIPGLGASVQTAEARINDLSKRTAEAAQRLAQARVQHRAASVGLAECLERFAQVSDMLMQVIHEHREGTPEGVPYQP